MENSPITQHYTHESGVKLALIQRKSPYHPPFSSQNPNPMKKHVDIGISTWEELNKFKYQNRCRTLSRAIALALSFANAKVTANGINQ